MLVCTICNKVTTLNLLSLLLLLIYCASILILIRQSHLGGARWLLPYKQLASSRDEGYHAYSTGATQFGTAQGCGPRRGAWTPEAVMFRKFCMLKRKNLDP